MSERKDRPNPWLCPIIAAAVATWRVAKKIPYRRRFPKIGNNKPCPCGSGLKWKECHGPQFK